MIGTMMSAGMMNVLGSVDPLSEVAARRLFTFEMWGMEIDFSNHMLMITFTAILLMVLIPLAVFRGRLVRTGAGNFVEAICVFIREEIARPFLGKYTDDYVGYLWTVFFFIGALNLLGMVPFSRIFYILTRQENHFEGAATANIFITGSLAFLAFIMIHVAGIRSQGLSGYLKHFIPPVPTVLKPLLFVIELISAFVKPFALAVRLFANVLAGHILLSTIMGFIFVFKNIFVAGGSIAFAVVMSVLEIFVACLQAYIFTFLTAIFIGFSVSPEH